MTRRPRRRSALRLELEPLEPKVVMTVSSVAPILSVPGGAAAASIGLTPGTGVSSAVEQSMNSAVSTDDLLTFLSETELIEGSQPAVQQFAEGVISSLRDADFAVQKLAGAQNVVLPFEMNSTDAATAAGVLASVNTTGFDTAYLNAMITAEQAKVTLAQNGASLDDAQYVTLLGGALTTAQSQLAAAQALLANPTGTPAATAITTQIGVGQPTGTFTVDASTPDTLSIYVFSNVTSSGTFNPVTDIDPTTVTINGVAFPGATISQDPVDENGDGVPDAIITITPRSNIGLTAATGQLTIAGSTLASSSEGVTTWGGTAAITVTGGTTPTSTLNATDATNLQTAYSVSSFQYYLHQLTNVIDGVNSPVGAYSAKLASDHAGFDLNAESIAFATNTQLPAGIPGNLEQVGASILGALTPGQINPNATTFSGLSAYDQAYLQFEVPSHQLMISMDQMAFVQAQNLSVKNLSYDDIFTSFNHEVGAQLLLNTYPPVNTGTGTGTGTTTTTGTGTPTLPGATTTPTGTTNAQYVTSTYESLLDRDPSQADLSFWTGLLNRGVSRQSVFQAISKSSERAGLLG